MLICNLNKEIYARVSSAFRSRIRYAPGMRVASRNVRTCAHMRGIIRTYLFVTLYFLLLISQLYELILSRHEGNYTLSFLFNRNANSAMNITK